MLHLAKTALHFLLQWALDTTEHLVPVGGSSGLGQVQAGSDSLCSFAPGVRTLEDWVVVGGSSIHKQDASD